MWSLMDSLPPGLMAFAAGYAAMLATPGPSFAVVSAASLSATRREAGLVATGVACGTSLLVLAVLRGAAGLPASPLLSEIGRFASTLLFLVMGYRALRRSLLPRAQAVRTCGSPGHGRYFTAGLVTALTNPISFAFFASVALTVRSGEAALTQALLPASVFVMAFGWFGLLSILLSLPIVRTLYGRRARQLDAVMGAMLIAIALSMAMRAA